MKKVKSGLIKLSDIKHLENSRIRGNEDVSDLMQDIEQRGLLQSVGIRLSDNTLIYGNRRVRAFELLGFKEIPADFFSEINDEDLLITNLVENIKRRNIGSVEIGRIVNILMKKGMMQSEISARLGISSNRVQSCSSAYNVAYDTKFMDLIKQKHHSDTGISESMLWKIQDVFRKIGYKPTKSDWNLIMVALEDERLNNRSLGVFRTILMNMDYPNIADALEKLEETKTVWIAVAVKRIEWEKLRSREKLDSDMQLVKRMIDKYDKSVLF